MCQTHTVSTPSYRPPLESSRVNTHVPVTRSDVLGRFSDETYFKDNHSGSVGLCCGNVKQLRKQSAAEKRSSWGIHVSGARRVLRLSQNGNRESDVFLCRFETFEL